MLAYRQLIANKIQSKLYIKKIITNQYHVDTRRVYDNSQ